MRELLTRATYRSYLLDLLTAGTIGAALLESYFSGPISPSLISSAPAALIAEIAPIASLYGSAGIDAALPSLSEDAVQAFALRLPARSQRVIATSDGKDYLVDVQNCILAFAGRVLLRKADIRFERGRRRAVAT